MPPGAARLVLQPINIFFLNISVLYLSEDFLFENQCVATEQDEEFEPEDDDLAQIVGV